MVSIKGIVEALLFSSPKPLSIREVVQALKAGAEYLAEEAPLPEMTEVKEPEVKAILTGLAQEYTELDRAFQLVEQVSGWQLTSRPEYQVWVRQLFPDLRPTRLSAPALETLAIIAYRQPITRADIEAIRGVAVDGLMQKLLDAGLVKIAGRADIPGRPLLYETTQHFMEHFGLKTLDELPNAVELRQLHLPTAQPSEEPAPAAEVAAEPQGNAGSELAANPVEPAETTATVSPGAPGQPGAEFESDVSATPPPVPEAVTPRQTEPNLNQETTSGKTKAIENPATN